MESTKGIEALLAVAEKFEQIGAEFYLQAARRAESSEVRQELERLAEMERAHDRTFAEMKAQYTGQPFAGFGPAQERMLAGQLKASRDSRVFGGDIDPARKMADLATMNEVIEFAMDMEKNSIVFYAGLVGLVGDEGFNQALQRIIQEEVNHLAALVDLPVY